MLRRPSRSSKSTLPQPSLVPNLHLPLLVLRLDIPLHPNTAPPWGPIYGMSAPELAEMKRYVTAYLNNGFIRPSKSPAAAPVMFVKRPDCKLRLVVDYRGLN